MRTFLFLIKTTKDRLASLSPAQMQRYVVNVRKFIGSMTASGQIKTAQPVDPNGIVLSGFRGAFHHACLETNAEILGAYYLVGAEDLSDALLLAKSDPRFDDAIWTIEIHPISDAQAVSEGDEVLEKSFLASADLGNLF
jgi:hypothetical protein